MPFAERLNWEDPLELTPALVADEQARPYAVDETSSVPPGSSKDILHAASSLHFCL